MMAQGKFHGGIITPTRELLRLGEAQHFAAVKFEEINRFGNVRVSFGPGLSHFVADERGQLEFAFANDVRGAENIFGAFLRGDFFPRVEIFAGGFDGLLGHVRAGMLEDPNDFHRARGIRGHTLFRGGDFLAVQPDGIFLAEFGRDFFERGFHGLAVFWLGEIDEWLVGELGDVNFLFSGSHGGFPPHNTNKTLYCVAKERDKPLR
jgi:hypothetical protein